MNQRRTVSEGLQSLCVQHPRVFAGVWFGLSSLLPLLFIEFVRQEALFVYYIWIVASGAIPGATVGSAIITERESRPVIWAAKRGALVGISAYLILAVPILLYLGSYRLEAVIAFTALMVLVPVALGALSGSALRWVASSFSTRPRLL